jgi:hypothetical protein
MDRKILLSVLGAALLGFFAVLLLMPPTIDDGTIRLPWRVEQDAQGNTRVFGFTLGQSTLADVRAVFGEDGTLNLFETPGRAEPFGVEAFFEQIYLQRLRADFVITLDADQLTLAPMYERGLRISQTGSGSKKVKLDPADAEALAGLPIRGITYLPQARLDEALLEQRFGTPDERHTEDKTGIVHWLYPARGVDLSRAPDGKVVIQYVNPAGFDALLRPPAGPGSDRTGTGGAR